MSDDQTPDTQAIPVLNMNSPSLLSEQPSTSYTNVLKRRASSAFEGLEEDTSRKRLKEQDDRSTKDHSVPELPTSGGTLADDLAQELTCGCCSELCYRPVVVSPCQHFFCGSCCVLWVRNGGSNCPACRGVSVSVTPSRPLQAIIDVLLRADPSKTRAERERLQADEVYQSGSLRIPTPKEASPEPNLNQSADFARPCPHCLPGNPYGWRCPQPIADPVADPDHAWHFDDGTPPGHSYCGNCENLLACRAPTTTRCDMCLVSFCGVGVQGRCVASLLHSQHPHGLSDIGDLIQSTEIYECFESNTVEVEYLLDYITAHDLTPRHIYREIVAHVQSQPAGFKPLIESGLFVDVHGVAASVDLNPDAARVRICRLCATEVFFWGVKEWWMRERHKHKGLLDEAITKRKDCADGSGCSRQKDLEHAREFNHIISPPAPQADLPQLAVENPLEGPPAQPSQTNDSTLLQDLAATSSSADSIPTSSQDFRDAVDALM